MSRLVVNVPLCSRCALPSGACRCRGVRNAKQKEKTFQDYAAFYGVETDPAADPVGAVKELLAAMDAARAVVAGEATDPEDLGPGGDMGADESTEDAALTGNAWVRDLLSRAASQRLEQDAQDYLPIPQPDYAELDANANERERQRRGRGGRGDGEAAVSPTWPPML